MKILKVARWRENGSQTLLKMRLFGDLKNSKDEKKKRKLGWLEKTELEKDIYKKKKDLRNHFKKQRWWNSR